MELGPCELVEHALFGGQPGADEGRPLQLILDFCLSQETTVVLVHGPFPLFLLQLPEGLHFLGCLGYDGGQVDLLSLGLLLERRELFHYLVVLMSFLYQVVSIRSKQSIYLLDKGLCTFLD